MLPFNESVGITQHVPLLSKTNPCLPQLTNISRREKIAPEMHLNSIGLSKNIDSSTNYN
jgi:hypothetical protein